MPLPPQRIFGAVDSDDSGVWTLESFLPTATLRRER